MTAQGLDWQSAAGYRSAPLTVNAAGRTGFTLMSPATTGVAFTNLLSEQRHLTNQILLNGSGVALGDMDGDGWCDIYLCRLDGPNALYRNLGGWKFEEVAERAEVGCPDLDATGAAFADLDGDGDLDLVVNSVGGGTHVFLNNGKGLFHHEARLNGNKGGTSLAIGDVDGDGYLDLYIANYRTSALMDMPNARATFKTVNGRLVVDRVNGRPSTDPDLANRFVVNERGAVEELGEVDSFCRNHGGTNFTLIPFTGGAFLDEDAKPLAAPPYDWGLDVMFRDLNDDGLPDIYVCNDFASPDRVWFNQGGGIFRAIPPLSVRRTSRFSMGIDFADINRDGFDDFVVLDMLSRDHRQRLVQESAPPVLPVIGEFRDRPQYGFNTLFLNRGDDTYAEIAQFGGVDASEWSWCPLFLDVDLDGYEDLLISNGQERAARDKDVIEQLRLLRSTKKMSDAEIFQERKAFPRLATANVAFRNRGDLTFEEVGAAWGFDARGISHGMAVADLDNDGDLDVVINNLNGPAGLYRNESAAPRVAVKLKGLAPNTRGIGAKVRATGGAVPVQSQEMICGGRYLSSDDPMRVFAAGSLTNQMRLEVQWRRGKRSVVEGIRANRIYEIEEPTEESSKLKAQSSREGPSSKLQAPGSYHQPSTINHQPFFEDVSRLIQHTHHEEPYDDFARQALLPRKLSQLGPGVAWCDLDEDGWEDLIIGSGKGGKLAVYRNDGKGGFQRLTEGPLGTVATRDQTAVLGIGKGKVLAGLANYEDGLALGACVRQYDLTAKQIEDVAPGAESSAGPLALGDVDGDGDLDLFVGGRVIGGRYPDAAASKLYRKEGGKWELDQANSRVMERAGMVSGAVWSDLDGDGFPELILACEWGPIRIFHNTGGQLIERTKEWGLSEHAGWWTGVTTGDLDGDGRLDLIAANWGLNTKYRASQEHPYKLYYGDLDGNGTVDLIEAYYDSGMKREVPERDLNAVGAPMPFLHERYTTHASYAAAGVQQIYGEKLNRAGVVQATTLSSMRFMNRGGRFEPIALPPEAQFSPALGVCVGDCDGDGNEDVFLSQNFFALPAESARADAGRGLWLRGDGRGNLAPVPGQESGVKAYGEQRGAALCDYNADGRIDLVVTQNGAETKLYRNVGAKPGLRVRLKGPPGNPSGVGAQIRVSFQSRQGPVRETHAGSGYWSQDGAVQIIGTPEPPTQIWVRWPGGKTTTGALPATAREIEVDPSGQIRTVR